MAGFGGRGVLERVSLSEGGGGTMRGRVASGGETAAAAITKVEEERGKEARSGIRDIDIQGNGRICNKAPQTWQQSRIAT